ncbi:MAG: SIMPL domain-containing protein [Victivallaceae bacterium]|nr:SIMPL domain-containing protein [Victivallaceae bacterium]
MQKNFGLRHVIVLALIIAAALIISACTLSRFFIKLEKDKLLCVKGFAEKIVKSDVGFFRFRITARTKTSPAACYKLLNRSMQTALAELKKYGFNDNEITPHNVCSSQIYKKEKGKETNEILYYVQQQDVTVKSNDVELIRQKHKELNSLLAQGIEIDVNSPEYFISDLNKYKIELLAQATENARLRAQTIAKNSGAETGKVVWAQQGVIQITAPLSTETSGDGIYNTDSLEKAIKLVVTLKYTVEK